MGHIANRDADSTNSSLAPIYVFLQGMNSISAWQRLLDFCFFSVTKSAITTLEARQSMACIRGKTLRDSSASVHFTPFSQRTHESRDNISLRHDSKLTAAPETNSIVLKQSGTTYSASKNPEQRIRSTTAALEATTNLGSPRRLMYHNPGIWQGMPHARSTGG